jgi:predicted small secreted protein
MKNTIKLIGIIALVTVIGFSMSACNNSGGGGGDKGGSGKNITIKITGLDAGDEYFITPKKGDVVFEIGEVPSVTANSDGTVSVSISIDKLKSKGLTGPCNIRFHKVGGFFGTSESKNTYNMDSPATHTLKSPDDFN